MNKKYYIELLDVDFSSKWSFESLESRNKIYEKVDEKFKIEKPSGEKFIEVNVGNEEQLGPTISMPLRLDPMLKEEVINYIDSLTVK